MFLGSALLFGLFGCRLAWLTQWSVPLGRDGYYYVLQVQSVLSSGTLYYHDWTALPIWVLSAFSWALGDTILGIKSGAAAFAVLSTLGSYLFVRDLTQRRACGTFAALLVACSTLQRYFLVEFLANSLAISIFTFFLWRALWALRVKSLANIAIALILGAVAAASHASAAAFVVASFAALTAIVWTRGKPDIGASTWPIVALLLAAFSVGVALSAALSPPEWRWLVWSFKPIPFPTLAGYASAAEERLVLLFVAFVAWRVTRNRPVIEAPERAALLVIIELCVALTVNPWGRYQTALMGAMERMALWNWIFMPILSATCLHMLIGMKSTIARATAVCVVIASWVSALNAREPSGSRPVFMMERIALQSELPKLTLAVPEGASVVAEHGTQFMITAITRLPAASISSASEPSPNLRYWFIRRGGLAEGTSWPNGALVLSRWLVMPESALLPWLAHLDHEQRTGIIRANPSQFGLAAMVNGSGK